MRVLPSCMYVCAVPAESGKGVGILEVGITHDCEPPYGYWELNLYPLQEQQLVLTLSHLPSPKDCYLVFLVLLWSS